MNKFKMGDVVSGRIRTIRRAVLPAGLPVHPDIEDVEVLLVVLHGHRGAFILLPEMAPSWLKIPDDGKSFLDKPRFSVDVVADLYGFVEAMRKTKKPTAK